MKGKLVLLLSGLLLSGLLIHAAPLGTAFTYQGRLDQNGQAANGTYQLMVELHSVPVGGTLLRTNLYTIAVSNGLFSVDMDFGSLVFLGEERWLDLRLSTNGANQFVTLTPRTRIAPTPNAMYASTAGTVTNGAIQLSQLGTSGTPPGPGQVLSYDGSSLVWQPSVWSLNGASAYYNDGNVGIGTATPFSPYKLDVAGQGNFRTGLSAGGDLLMNGAETEAALGIFRIYGKAPPQFPNPTARFIVQKNGNVGIGIVNPTEKLHVAGEYLRVDGTGGEAAYIGGDGVGNDIQVGSLNPTVTDIYMYNAGNSTHMHTHVGVLTIHGGSDLAEPFPMKENLQKGSVVVIDDEHPGQLKRSTRAYDTRVAGIISGANGIRPGISLKQEGALDQGENVALTGRVYVTADASFGAIKPGDLLTTSDTPGHAMKVTEPARAQGAILGKAMSTLADGKGFVLVLVTLQ